MATFEVIRTGERINKPCELLDKVYHIRKRSRTGAVWLRGLPDATYELTPSIGRPHCYAGETFTFGEDDERGILHRFRRHAYEYAGRELSEWEAMFIGRHYGLPVRIMDWTANPYAALYFACDYRKDGPPPDAKIWMLVPVHTRHLALELNVFNKEMGPFDVKGIQLVYPMVVASRINAQTAFFTIQENPWTALDKLAGKYYPDDQLHIRELHEFIVPGDVRFKRLADLNRFGVNQRTLFPDYGGLAQGLLDADILRWGKKGSA